MELLVRNKLRLVVGGIICGVVAFIIMTMHVVGTTVPSKVKEAQCGVRDVQCEQQPAMSKYIGNGMFEYVSFPTDHGTGPAIVRNALFLKRENPRGTVLICHGYMCDKFDIGFLRLLFPDFNILTFDFRAHGENIDAHQMCTFGRDEAKDVAAAVRYLRSREETQGKPLLVYGFSMGAVASIIAQGNERLFDAMILDCPFDHSKNIIKRGLENMRISILGYTFDIPGKALLEKYAFSPWVQTLLKAVLKTVANMDATATNTCILPVSPRDSIKKVEVPCLFIHCKNDEKVTVAAARTIYNNAAGFKRLWLTSGRRHFDSFFYNPEKYFYKVQSFVNKVLSGTYHAKVQAKVFEDSTT